MTASTNTTPAGLTRLGQAGAAVAVLGAAGMLFGVVNAHGDPATIKNLLQSYLFGWVLAMLLCLGCLGFTLLHHMTRGSWAQTVIRMFEAGARTLPIMFLLYLPMLIWARYIYPWANHDLVYGNAALGIKADETLLHRAAYMSPPIFAMRTMGYFVIWSVLAYVVSWSVKRQDETGNFNLALFRQKMCSVGFLIYVVTTSLAFTDWIMSLDTHWFSTLYGLWFVDFQGLATIAFVSLIVCRQKLAHKEPYNSLVTPQVTRDLGNLMLTLTMVWAYFSLSTWIIIWSGNLPEEVTFFLRRNQNMFILIGAANIIFSFFAPFVMLLSGRTKRTPGLLALVSVLVLFMRFVDIFWVVVPVTRHPIQLIPSDIAGTALLVGAFIAAFGYMLRQAEIVPRPEKPLVLEAAHG